VCDNPSATFDVNPPGDSRLFHRDNPTCLPEGLAVDNIINMHADDRLRRHCRFSAFLGAGIWLGVTAPLPRDSQWMITSLLLFVPLVLIRLGFAFMIPHGHVIRYRWWYTVSYSQLPAAIFLTAAFLTPAGTVAGLLALPWFCFTLLLAGLALDEIRHRPTLVEFGRLGAMLLLPVGAAWALMSRSGLQPLGFAPIIVLLTAVHFHYAGFALPLLAGELLRWRNNVLNRALLIAVLAGVPMVAVGITTTQLGGPREVELLAAITLAVVGILLGLGHVRQAAHWPGWVGLLLAVSGLSLIAALGNSGLYALGQYGLIPRIEIPFMVHWHGAINAVGCALCGLFAWHLVLTRPTGRIAG